MCEILKVHAGEKEVLACQRHPKPWVVGGNCSPRKFYKLRVLETRSPAFSAGHFQSIKTEENAVISYLFYSIQFKAVL